MGGALQAIARSSPARGARMEGRKEGKMATRRRSGEGRNVLRKRDKGKGLSYHHIWP